MRQLSSSAPYSVLAEAAEKLEATRLELNNEEVRTEALKVLHDTVEQSRSEAFASIPEESILRRILGVGFGNICLSENLAVSDVEPDSASLTVPLCELSGVALKHHALTHIKRLLPPFHPFEKAWPLPRNVRLSST